ncbi:tRNA (guanosine(46)-N7)-methyltransferase TrmB [Verrucomicrobiales bacterium]|jgi:tRNA (guanine-N7-)-methyltransferase|nr:tRNA (guanosine(46)-N7)-methyltransferase TrmB [Verrucomicrobiales bacterium]
MPKDKSFPFPNEVYPPDWFAPMQVADLSSDDRPLELDLGCGDGSFLIQMAEHHPERDFLAVERLLGRVRKVCRKIDRAGLTNAKALRADSNYVVSWLLPKGAFHRIHFLCPDPWPKKKHARRRQMCQMPFLQALHDILAPGGELLFMTDSPVYFAESLETQEGCDFFEQKPWEPGDFYYAQTAFEKQWIEQGRSMNRLRLAAL